MPGTDASPLGSDPTLRIVDLFEWSCYPRSMNARSLISRIKAAASGLAARLRPHRPAMIGTPPSARPMWHDPAAHARDFAERYADPMEIIVAQRMRDLGLPDNQIGFADPDHGPEWHAFFPQEGKGGGVFGDKIAADAGLFDADLMTRKYDTPR
jgi:hypothetical protein